MNYRVGIFGGMGSGKSTVLSRLQSLGASVLSADAVNAELLCRPEYMERVGELCPACLVDGAVDKKILRTWITQDEANRRALMALAHPYIRDEIVRRTDIGLWFVELTVFVPDLVPLNESWHVVSAPMYRLARVVYRGGISIAEAEALIRAQNADGLAPADAILFPNEGTVEDLYRLVDARYRSLAAKF